ncbi:MAG: SulP family inorganic anion transporter, partial [Chloroflexota bacterium]
AAAKSYAAEHHYEVVDNQEMIAIGVANLGAGFSQAFVVDGSLSRTAAADESGQRSQMASLINSVLVLVTAVLLTPLFRSLPEAVLGAIVIHAVWRLINFREMQSYYPIRRPDFWAAVVALQEADQPVQVVLVDAEVIPDIDITGLAMLEELHMELSGREIELWFARVGGDVMNYIRSYSLEESIGPEHFYLSVRAGVDAYLIWQNTKDAKD